MKQTSLLLFIMSFLLIGCVGTVQDAQEAFTKASDAPKLPIIFAGVTSVSAISDSRIEVFFYPASGGSGKYTYDIMVGSSPFPISIPSDVMTPDYRGLLKTTITGLNRLTTYQVRVEVRDSINEVQSNSQILKSATTFDNQVADFNGISSAANTPGQDGKDSIKIRWTPARTSGGLTKQTWEPKSYEVVLVDADRLTPNDMDVEYTSTQGRWVFAFNHDNSMNEYIVRGLPSQTRFYVRIRAIHEGSVDDVYDPKKRSELNTNYITISTLSASLADINFPSESFAVTLATGVQGLSAVQANWNAAAGVFDHYRLYYSQVGGGVSTGVYPEACLSPMLSDPGETVFCKKVDFDKASSPITGLLPYTSYEAVLILCATTACGPSERLISPVRTITTDPNSPVFNGVKEVKGAQTLGDLGKLFVEFDVPNFATGYFDGLILKMRRTVDGSDTAVEITEFTTPVSLTAYNFLTQSQVVLTGVDYLSSEPYCFTLYPYKYDSDEVTRRESPNDIWKCIQPNAEAPTVDQFLGLASGRAENNTVYFTWNAPTSGIFANYELYWRKLSGASFTWGDAVVAANNFDYTNYGVFEIDSDQTDITLENIPSGSYAFGILTRYTYITDNGEVTIRSETNGNILRCIVDDTQVNVTIDCGN